MFGEGFTFHPFPSVALYVQAELDLYVHLAVECDNAAIED